MKPFDSNKMEYSGPTEETNPPYLQRIHPSLYVSGIS